MAEYQSIKKLLKAKAKSDGLMSLNRFDSSWKYWIDQEEVSASLDNRAIDMETVDECCWKALYPEEPFPTYEELEESIRLEEILKTHKEESALAKSQAAEIEDAASGYRSIINLLRYEFESEGYAREQFEVLHGRMILSENKKAGSSSGLNARNVDLAVWLSLNPKLDIELFPTYEQMEKQIAKGKGNMQPGQNNRYENEKYDFASGSSPSQDPLRQNNSLGDEIKIPPKPEYIPGPGSPRACTGEPECYVVVRSRNGQIFLERNYKLVIIEQKREDGWWLVKNYHDYGRGWTFHTRMAPVIVEVKRIVNADGVQTTATSWRFVNHSENPVNTKERSRTHTPDKQATSGKRVIMDLEDSADEQNEEEEYCHARKKQQTGRTPQEAIEVSSDEEEEDVAPVLKATAATDAQKKRLREKQRRYDAKVNRHQYLSYGQEIRAHNTYDRGSDDQTGESFGQIHNWPSHSELGSKGHYGPANEGSGQQSNHSAPAPAWEERADVPEQLKLSDTAQWVYGESYGTTQSRAQQWEEANRKQMQPDQDPLAEAYDDIDNLEDEDNGSDGLRTVCDQPSRSEYHVEQLELLKTRSTRLTQDFIGNQLASCMAPYFLDGMNVVAPPLVYSDTNIEHAQLLAEGTDHYYSRAVAERVRSLVAPAQEPARGEDDGSQFSGLRDRNLDKCYEKEGAAGDAIQQGLEELLAFEDDLRKVAQWERLNYDEWQRHYQNELRTVGDLYPGQDLGELVNIVQNNVTFPAGGYMAEQITALMEDAALELAVARHRQKLQQQRKAREHERSKGKIAYGQRGGQVAVNGNNADLHRIQSGRVQKSPSTPRKRSPRRFEDDGSQVTLVD